MNCWANCLHLGNADVNVVFFKEDLDAGGRPSVKYGNLLRYPEPPKWMTNSLVLENWTQLQNLLTLGEACDGHFNYSKADRDLRRGGDSCWPAFNRE